MKKIISLLVVLSMMLSCFGVTALANTEELPVYDVELLTGDELEIADDFTLDYGMSFKAVDTEETVVESPYKDYLCDFVITFSEDVNAILAGQYDKFSADEWVILKTEKGEEFAGLTEFGYKFNKDEEVMVLSTMMAALQEKDIIDTPEEAVFTYEDIVNIVKEFNCGLKIVDEIPVDVTLELCLFDPANPAEKIVVGNPEVYSHEAAEFPEALIIALTKDELSAEGFDLSGNEFKEALDFGMNFKAVDTAEDLIDNPFARYSVDFEIEFSEDVTAIMAGQYENDYSGDAWVAVKGFEGDYEGITEKGYSFQAGVPVRIMETAFEIFPFTGSAKRIAYWEVVEGIKDFNCGVKLTSNKDVTITLNLCLYEIGADGNETGFKYTVNDGMVFDYKAVSIPEEADDDEKVEIINNATSINEENKEIVAEAIKNLAPEKQEEIKTEVLDAVADTEVAVEGTNEINATVNTIENTNEDVKIVIEKKPETEENAVVFDINAYEGTVSEETKIEETLEAPVVIRIPLSAFGVNVIVTALYHEHEGVTTKIDFVIKDGYVVFTANKFSAFTATLAALVDGEATLNLVKRTDAQEGTEAYDVVLKGDTFRTIQNFGAGEFVVNVDGDAKAEFVLNPEIDALNTNLYQFNNKYVISVEDELENIWSKDETYSENNSFVLGTITLTGWGKAGTLEISDIIMNKHTDSLVNGGTDTREITVTNDTASVAFDIPVPQRTLNVEVYLAHATQNQKAAYQNMKVTVTKGGVVVKETALGKDDVEFDEATNTYKVSYDLDLNANYLVTVTGAGYRKSSKNISLTDNKTVNFWSNILNGETNFLAGDIVGDDIIDIYDISAVVSYFDQRASVLAESVYSTYDLNRDGIINSKDVNIVNHGWGK